MGYKLREILLRLPKFPLAYPARTGKTSEVWETHAGREIGESIE